MKSSTRRRSTTSVREGRYRFLVNFTDYLDTGLFLDHRITRSDSVNGRRENAS